jgi:hypothetical protein
MIHGEKGRMLALSKEGFETWRAWTPYSVPIRNFAPSNLTSASCADFRSKTREPILRAINRLARASGYTSIADGLPFLTWDQRPNVSTTEVRR